jgi:hypothetical protein
LFDRESGPFLNAEHFPRGVTPAEPSQRALYPAKKVMIPIAGRFLAESDQPTAKPGAFGRLSAFPDLPAPKCP